MELELSTYFRFLLALIFVLALIGILSWVARRYGILRGTARPTPGKRRLEVVEITPIDSKRRLVLLRRDDTEHLILMSPTNELVVETGITPPPRSDNPSSPIFAKGTSE
jgi:flagellar protein FliO/FliZ